MLKVGMMDLTNGDFLDEVDSKQDFEDLEEFEARTNGNIKERSLMRSADKNEIVNMDERTTNLVRPHLVTTIITQVYSNGSTKTTTINEKEVPEPDTVFNFNEIISVPTTATFSWKKYNLVTYSKVATNAQKLSSALQQHETDRIKVIVDKKVFIGTIDAQRNRIYSLKDAMTFIEDKYGDIVKRDVILDYNIINKTIEIKIQ